MNIQALHFVLDIDGNGTIAGWETLEAIKWVLSLPGRLLVEAMGSVPWLAQLLDIQASPQTGYASFHGLLAWGFSLLFWAAIIIALMNLGCNRRQQQASPSSTADEPKGEGLAHYRGPRHHKGLKTR